MPKFIFVTGGVVSSLGKGIAASALAALLQAREYKVRLRKLDPYLNVDPGTMSPYQHGEVFVTDDGAETDLDLGHYERFTGVSARKTDSITTGRIYSNVISKERRGDYLGATVQVIPHITDEIKNFIGSDLTDEDFIICEIGGTVGDIESLPFLEAIRQFGNEVGHDKVLYVHLTLLPYIPAAGELKTKPTQHSVKELLSVGIQPQVLLCRCDRPIPESERAKISLFCNIPKDNVIEASDVDSIYQVPISYHEQGLDTVVLNYFKMPTHNTPHLLRWEEIMRRVHTPQDTVSIGVIGKYTSLLDAYKSLHEALIHGGISNQIKVEITWIDSDLLNANTAHAHLKDFHGILVPGGFGERGTAGMLVAIQYAREQNIPWFGICFGMQLAVIEFARHVLGLKDANTSEFTPDLKNPLVGLLTEWEKDGKIERRHEGQDLGGTMRLGAYECMLKEGTKTRDIYESPTIQERHRHRYEVNVNYRPQIEAAGLIFSGLSPDGLLPEMVELKGHPWFIGCQFHPELKSKPFDPHPLFVSFTEAAWNTKKKTEPSRLAS